MNLDRATVDYLRKTIKTIESRPKTKPRPTRYYDWLARDDSERCYNTKITCPDMDWSVVEFKKPFEWLYKEFVYKPQEMFLRLIERIAPGYISEDMKKGMSFFRGHDVFKAAKFIQTLPKQRMKLIISYALCNSKSEKIEHYRMEDDNDSSMDNRDNAHQEIKEKDMNRMRETRAVLIDAKLIPYEMSKPADEHPIDWDCADETFVAERILPDSELMPRTLEIIAESLLRSMPISRIIKRSDARMLLKYNEKREYFQFNVFNPTPERVMKAAYEFREFHDFLNRRQSNVKNIAYPLNSALIMQKKVESSRKDKIGQIPAEEGISNNRYRIYSKKLILDAENESKKLGKDVPGRGLINYAFY